MYKFSFSVYHQSTPILISVFFVVLWIDILFVQKIFWSYTLGVHKLSKQSKWSETTETLTPCQKPLQYSNLDSVKNKAKTSEWTNPLLWTHETCQNHENDQKPQNDQNLQNGQKLWNIQNHQNHSFNVKRGQGLTHDIKKSQNALIT